MPPPPSGVARGDLIAGPAVRLHEPLHQVDQPREIGHRPHRGPRIEAAKEADLVAVNVAGTGHDPLVDERLTDRPLGLIQEPFEDLVGVPIRAEDVGSEMSHHLVFPCRRDEFGDAQPRPHRDMGLSGEDHTHVVGRAGPRLPRSVQIPAAVHLEVRMEGDLALGSEQQVLASRNHLGQHATRQIRRGESGNPKVGSQQALSADRRIEAAGGQNDGVTLGHVHHLS